MQHEERFLSNMPCPKLEIRNQSIHVPNTVRCVESAERKAGVVIQSVH